jgi:hypothetical protein
VPNTLTYLKKSFHIFRRPLAIFFDLNPFLCNGK